MKHLRLPKYWLFLACSFLPIAQLVAQEIPLEEKPLIEKSTIPTSPQEKPAWRERLHYGGNLWLGFFGSFYVDVSPMVGYEVTSRGTVAGLGGTFIYQGGGGIPADISVGPRLFVRQAVWRSIFVHAEYEWMRARTDQFYSYDPLVLPNEPSRLKWEGAPVVGIGFYQGQGGQSGSFLALMYNLGYPIKGFVSPQGLGGRNSPLSLRFGFFF